jgi:hypothetical protein
MAEEKCLPSQKALRRAYRLPTEAAVHPIAKLE